jgi:uncharacterized iron-regulated membrane protein
MNTVTAKSRFKFRPRVWLQRLHLWASLTLGIVLLVTTTSGSIALFHQEVDQALDSKYYQVTPGKLISFEEAGKIIKKAYQTEPVHEVIRANENAPYYANVGVDFDKKVYVDPGTGQINGVKSDSGTFMGFFAKLHTSLFLGDVKFKFPKWLPEWMQKWIGEDLASLVLKIVALSLGIMVITGAVLWFPGIKKMAYSFKLRLNGSSYLRQYDWHKILGFIALPFLGMWGLTAMNFYEPFHPIIEKVWYSATFANVQPAPENLKSEAKNKTIKDQISIARLREIALKELPVGSSIINLGVPDLSAKFKDKATEQEARESTITIWGSKGLDPYKFSEYPGQYGVTIDQYSGKVLDKNEARLAVFGSNVFENWFYPIHAGIAVPWWARIVWFVFGLIPLFLAVTGIRMYLIKRGGRVAKKREQQITPVIVGAND